MPKTDTNLDLSFLKNLRRPAKSGRPVTNLIGRKFDRVTPLGFLGLGQGGAKWLCKCDCGSIWVVTSVKLTGKTTHSCGCYKDEQTANRSRTHGLTADYQRHRVLQIQSSMITRCYNDKNDKYLDYGGRGIRVCRRWHTPIFFYDDMGDPPSAEHSIDRIENSGNYSCGKCDECLENGWPLNARWATRFQQARNKRTNRLLTANGETLCIAEWAEKLNNNPTARTIWKRKHRNWSDAEALGFIQRT